MDNTAWTFVLTFVGVLVSIVGFFVVRAMNSFDKALEAHDRRLSKHDEQIANLISTTNSLTQVLHVQLNQINEKLDEGTQWRDEQTERIRDFYETYQLIKK